MIGEPQPEDGCSSCGKRVKPGFSECPACLHGELPDAPAKPKLPRVVCHGYVTANWQHIPCVTGGVIQEGEPGGLIQVGECVTCGALEQKAQETRRARNARQIRHNAARGYHLDPDTAFDGIKYDAEPLVGFVVNRK